MKKIKLYCIPYAGGSTTVFKPWKPFLDESIELCPIELAGRGKRFNDDFYDSVDEAVSDILNLISEDIEDSPYAIFGHSMGAVLSYELARRIVQKGKREPVHIFFSGRGAPQNVLREDKLYHTLPEDKFKAKVMELGGTPPEFFEHPELLDLFLPLLRHDFKLAYTDFSDRELIPYNCDISVLIGKEEDITPPDIDAWKKYTKGICAVNYFNGEHFFLNDQVEAVTNLVNATLIKTKIAIPNLASF